MTTPVGTTPLSNESDQIWFSVPLALPIAYEESGCNWKGQVILPELPSDTTLLRLVGHTAIPHSRRQVARKLNYLLVQSRSYSPDPVYDDSPQKTSIRFCLNGGPDEVALLRDRSIVQMTLPGVAMTYVDFDVRHFGTSGLALPR